MSRKFALVIGNSEYDDPKLARLRTPSRDVDALAGVLKDPAIGQFDDVVPVVNQTMAVVFRAIAAFFVGKKPGDLLLLYFSGHGVKNEEGDLYLAVKDTDSRIPHATAVPARFITSEMDRGRSRRQILILDCCHSGAFAPGMKGALGGSVGTASTFRGNGTGRVVLTATDSTEYAWEGDRVTGEPENSVFTRYLIQGLRTGEADLGGDGWITVNELYDYAYTRVVSETQKQTPGKWSYREQGEIVLAKSPIVRPVPLPDDLQHAVTSTLVNVRLGAVTELATLLSGGHPGLALAAHKVLTDLTRNDSRRVSEAATEALTAYEAQRTAAMEQARAQAERVATEQAKQEEQDWLAREKAEQDRRAQEEVEAERVARETAEQEERGRLAVEGAEQERLEAERTEAERVAAEKAEADQLRLAAEQATAERIAAEQVEQERLAREKVLPRRPLIDRRTFMRVSAGVGVATIMGLGTWQGIHRLTTAAILDGWVFETGDEVYSSPTVHHGTVYIGSSDHYLYALDAATGAERWRYATAGAVTSSPHIADGVLYVGSNDTFLHAVDAETGERRWSFPTSGPIHSSPTVVDGIVFIGCRDHNVYAIDAATGEARWKFTGGDWFNSSPIVADGTLYIGCRDHEVYALNTETGEKRWSYTTNSTVDSSATVSGGTVWIGSDDKSVYALSTKSGAWIWQFNAGGGVVSTPCLEGRVLYVGCDDGKIYALDATTGRMRWSFPTGNSIRSSPAIADGVLYIGSRDGNLYALDATSGAERWRHATRGPIDDSSPAIAGGRVYVGSLDRCVYAVDAATGRLV